MTLTALTAAITLACGLAQTSPNWGFNRLKKEECMEKAINCAIDSNSVVRADAAIKCFNKAKTDAEG
jgi:hypothetical protein